ncbi:hypothetical protein [uncultured Microbacterium sp.]|uniref:hypothetical protein n=1 Tax=uncultured Microbacterium sp. TaxID=191216 RepID=UPI0028D3DB23|nr:hypothetical protein [uncultured Microbacterium sp.]
MVDDKYLVTRTRADAAERASKAWRMRVAGGGWDDIAKALGMKGGAPAAYRAVKNYFGKVPQVDREMLREIARQRGERLWLRAAAAVEEAPSPAAIRAAVAVLERVAKLDGLDAPSRVEVSPEAADFMAVIDAAARGMGLVLPVEADIFDAEYVDADEVEEDQSSS